MTGSCSFVDEIVLSYVVSILEELGSESGQEELFDVESFSEYYATVKYCQISLSYFVKSLSSR